MSEQVLTITDYSCWEALIARTNILKETIPNKIDKDYPGSRSYRFKKPENCGDSRHSFLFGNTIRMATEGMIRTQYHKSERKQ